MFHRVSRRQRQMSIRDRGSNGIELDLTDVTNTAHQTDPGEDYLASRPAKAPAS